MNVSTAYIATMAALLMVAFGIGLVLMRYRDKLQSAFGTQQKRYRAVLDIAPHARLVVVEIDGYRVLCGLGKDGLRSTQVLGKVGEE